MVKFIKRVIAWKLSVLRNPVVQRYIRSSVVTFLGVFIPVFSLSYSDADLQSVTLVSALGAILVVATRAGVKAVLESWAGQLK